MPKGICKFCNQEKDLIKAHIIPKGFYKNISPAAYKSLNIDDGTWFQTQNGIKDNNILCAECDNHIIGSFEKEGYRVLKEEIYKHIENNKQNRILYHLKKADYDYKLLRNFFISILWRASISKLDDCQIVELGIYEDIALEILQNKNTHNNLFKIMLFKAKEESLTSQVVFLTKRKYYNATMYKILMLGYDIIICVNYDSIPRDEKIMINRISLNENDLYVYESDDIATENFQTIVEVFHKWESAKNNLMNH